MRRVGIAIALLWLLQACDAGGARQTSATAAMDLGRLPDWSGVWILQPQGQPITLTLMQAPPELHPQLLAPFLEGATRLLLSGEASIDYCRPAEFVGYQNGEGFEDVLEFLFTPGRVTLLNERGLVRRIHTAGGDLAGQAEPNWTGFSIARWEDDTLVVETTALLPSIRFPLAYNGALRLGRDARVFERMRLLDADTLQIDAELHAPELLVQPLRVTSVFRRDRRHLMQDKVNCPAQDRLVDPLTRATRFDLTPPPDLPPPP